VFIDNAVAEKSNVNNEVLPDLKKKEKKVNTIQTLVGCMETAQQTIEMMEKLSKKTLIKLNRDKVHQLIQLH
jgi:hypothetical protein